MILFFALILLTAAIAVRPSHGFRDEHLSPASCLPVKGLFTMLIVPSHFVGYLQSKGAWDMPYMDVRSWMGQGVVCFFLFCSGFGVMNGILRKGITYIRAIPRKRLLTVLADMTLAVLLYALVQWLLGRPQPWDRILLSCIGWVGLGNSCWYIHVILVCYLFTWFAAAIFRDRHWGTVLLTALWLTAYALVLKRAGKEDYWYNTILIYSMGMAWRLVKPALDKRVMKPMLPWLSCLVLAAAGVLLLKPVRQQHLPLYWLWAACFTLIPILLDSRIALKSPVLYFFGRHVFSIYILQRLPMIVLSSWGLIDPYPLLSLLLCFAVTCPLAALFDLGTERLHRLWLRE